MEEVRAEADQGFSSSSVYFACSNICPSCNLSKQSPTTACELWVANFSSLKSIALKGLLLTGASVASSSKTNRRYYELRHFRTRYVLVIVGSNY